MMRLLPTSLASTLGADAGSRISPAGVPQLPKHYLVASDFDQTLSFNDSGEVLSELLGRPGFKDKVDGLAGAHLVQQGGELAYLLLHDPEYRCVRKEHLAEVGKRIRLKQNIDSLLDILAAGVDGHRFSFYVISAAPEEVVRSALEGIVPPENIHGTRFDYDTASDEIRSVARLTAGYGKVAVLDELQAELQVGADRIVYVGDGSSDIHVMLHVNRRNGFTIAVSENKHIAPIARRTVLSDNALSVLVPVLEDVVGWDNPAQVRGFFEAHGLAVQEWDKMQVDVVTFREGAGGPAPHSTSPTDERFE
jgi:2-hydroxy-3-keto-5-methylthiopentenyl-1-phosphate phosphatase